MGWVFIGIIACVLVGWYVYHRSKNDTAESTDQVEDVVRVMTVMRICY